MLTPSKRAALIDPSADLFRQKADDLKRTLYQRAAALKLERQQYDQGPETPEWRVRKWNAETVLIRQFADLLQAAEDAVRIAHTATKGASAALEAATKVNGLDATILLDQLNQWKRLYHERGKDVEAAEARAAKAEGEKLALIGQMIAGGVWPLPQPSDAR